MIFFRTAAGRLPRRDLWRAGFSSAPKFARFLALILLATFEQSPGQSLQSDQHRVIRGTVVNAVTQAPIPRALVFSPDNRFATLTDGEGHFELSVPEAKGESEMNSASPGPLQGLGAYRNASIPVWLMARKPGFLDDVNGARQVAAALDTETTIPLLPEALIKGRITLSTSDAAVGIVVQLFSRQVVEGLSRWVPTNNTIANSVGEFRFAELRPGAYKLLTHEWMDNDPVANVPGGPLFGFPPVYYPGAADFTSASPIELAAGQTVEADLPLTSQQYYNVRIPVANGENNGGMNVTVRGQRGPGYSLGYNQAMQRIEGLLPNGNYVVEANVFGPNSATGSVNLRVAGAPVEGPAMMLSRSSSINVIVKEEFSDRKWNGSASWAERGNTFTLHGPRAYLNVDAESVDDIEQPRRGSLRPPTANDESLVIENLPQGRYRLLLNSSRGYIASATFGGVDLLHNPFSVDAGSSGPIEITVRDDFATLDVSLANVTSGTSLAESDTVVQQPVAWVYCVPLPDSLGKLEQVGLSGDEKSIFPQMAPGAYRVLAFTTQQPNLPYRDPEAMRAYDSKGTVIHLAAGQKATVQVPVISGSE